MRGGRPGPRRTTNGYSTCMAPRSPVASEAEGTHMWPITSTCTSAASELPPSPLSPHPPLLSPPGVLSHVPLGGRGAELRQSSAAAWADPPTGSVCRSACKPGQRLAVGSVVWRSGGA